MVLWFQAGQWLSEFSQSEAYYGYDERDYIAEGPSSRPEDYSVESDSYFLSDYGQGIGGRYGWHLACANNIRLN